jgi:hypothetical protein
MSDTKVRPLSAVTLPVRDWVHVINAVESSFQRKVKRKDFNGADEMKLIGMSIVQQVESGK